MGQSDILERILLTNTSDEAIDVSFIQYVDMDLDFDAANDTAWRVNANLVRQVDGDTVFEEAHDTASVGQIACWPDILDQFTFNEGLTDEAGPLSANECDPDMDLEFGLQWDVAIQPGGRPRDRQGQAPGGAGAHHGGPAGPGPGPLGPGPGPAGPGARQPPQPPQLAPIAQRSCRPRAVPPHGDDHGNLKINVDFRSVYAAIIDDWLGADHTAVLPGGPFPPAPVIA